MKGENKPSILVFNKIDAFTFVPKDEDDLSPMTKENISLEQLQQTWMARLGNDCLFVSARDLSGVDSLKALLYERVRQIHVERYPYNDFLFQDYESLLTDEEEL